MGYEYQVLTERDEFLGLYHRMREENLLWALFPEIEAGEWSEGFALAMLLERPDILVLGGYVDGELAGFLMLTPMRFRGRVGEVGLLAFRKFFREALPLCGGAFDWVFREQDCEALLGFIPVASRQSMRLFSRLGFRAMGRVPGMSWYAKKKRFVDNEIVMLTKGEWNAQSKHAENAGTGTGTAESPDTENPDRKHAAEGGGAEGKAQ